MQPYCLGETKTLDAKASLAYIPLEHRWYLSNLISNNFGYNIQAMDALNGSPAEVPVHQPQLAVNRKVVFREKRKRSSKASGKKNNNVPDALHTQSVAHDVEDHLEVGEVEYLLQSLPPDEHFLDSDTSLEEQLKQARKKQKSVRN
jgi:hypothetical protein